MVWELCGEFCLVLEEFVFVKQEIICSCLFGDWIMVYEDMCQVICSYVVWVVEKLCGEYQYCWFVFVFVKISFFVLNEFYYGNSVLLKLLMLIQDFWDIIVVVMSCLDVIWKVGYCYQKVGVMFGDFYSQGVVQLNLFDEFVLWYNSVRLMQVFDQLNVKNGRGVFYFVGQGIQQQWQMK